MWNDSLQVVMRKNLILPQKSCILALVTCLSNTIIAVVFTRGFFMKWRNYSISYQNLVLICALFIWIVIFFKWLPAFVKITLFYFSRQQFSRSVVVSLITASVNRDVVCRCRGSEWRTHRTYISLTVYTTKSLLLQTCWNIFWSTGMPEILPLTDSAPGGSTPLGNDIPGDMPPVAGDIRRRSPSPSAEFETKRHKSRLPLHGNITEPNFVWTFSTSCVSKNSRNSSTLSNFKSALKSHLFTWLYSRGCTNNYDLWRPLESVLRVMAP